MESSTPYIVSARKYRPATFRSVVGQSALTSTLIGAIGSGRLAHAYLFCGPRGVGKTSCARIFAKTINCLNPNAEGEACGECDSCRAIDEGTSFNIVELDAASNNGVDQMRQLIEQVAVPPQVGKYRVFIIDEVHMLSSSAFNAFLKTLEEPPKHVIFILATTEKQKVIPTVLSRCQIYDFKRITVADIAEHLAYVASEEGVTADPMALNVIAQKADGAMRDALSIFDQVAAASSGVITYASTIANLNVLDYDYYFKLIDAFMAGDVREALLIYKEIRDKGFDSLFFVNGLANHVRNVMVAADVRTIPLLEVGKEIAERYIEQARTVPVKWHYEALKILNDCDLNYRIATDKQLLVELALIRLATLNGTAPVPSETKPLPQPTPVQRPVPQAQPAARPQAVQQPAAKPQPARQSVQPRTAAMPQPSQPQPEAPQRQAPAQSAPREASEPQPAPVQRPSRGVRPKVAQMQTVRISQATEGDNGGEATAGEPTSDEPAPVNPQRKEPEHEYSEEDVVKVWDSFATENVEMRMLSASMRASKPEKMEGDAYRVTVVSPNEKEQFEENMNLLLAYFREKLGNNDFTLKVDVAESIEGMDVYVPPHDFVKKTMEKNSVISRLFSELDAALE